MLSKNQIKFVRSLEMKKFREIHRQFTAEGTKLVLELLAAGVPVRMIFATPGWISGNTVTIPGELVSATPEELARITTLATAPPVIAVFDIPEAGVLPPGVGSDLVLLLDDIRDPGNLGTIIRVADWFGIKRIICSETSVDLYNPKVVQATMGSIARVEVWYAGAEEWLANMPGTTCVYGTTLDGGNLYSTKLSPSGVIIIGNESKGISEGILNYVTHKLFIPSFSTSSHAESLNASVATAVVCAEFRRQFPSQ